MKPRQIVLLLLIINLFGVTQAQVFVGTDDLPLSGVYHVQQITNQCEDRYNGQTTSRFVVDQFRLNDDGNLLIGNENRSLLYRATDQTGVFTNNIDGGTQRTLTVVSDTLFVQDIRWSSGLPCQTQMIYTYAIETPPDIDAIDGIPLPQATAGSDIKFNWNLVRENCPLFGDRVFTRDDYEINFKLQHDGSVLVAQFGNVEGYSTGTYFIRTTSPNVYVFENEYSYSYIYLYSPEYFRRDIFYDDGCTISNTYFLPIENLFDDEGTAFAEPNTTLDDSSTTTDTDSPDTNTVALNNGLVFEPDEAWTVRSVNNNDQLIFNYRDEASDTRIEARALMNSALLFGASNYDPNSYPINDLMNIYFQSVPPNYSSAGLSLTETTLAGQSATMGEVITDEFTRRLYVVENSSGRFAITTLIPSVASADAIAQVEALLTSINTDFLIDSPADFMIDLDTGEQLIPDSAEVAFGDFPQFNIFFFADGVTGETTTITIYPNYPITSGTFDLRTPSMTDLLWTVGVSIPVMFEGELYTVVYASSVDGMMQIDTNGVSMDGTLDFAATYTRLNKEFEVNLTPPDNFPTFPQQITVSGTFSNLVPPPIDEE